MARRYRLRTAEWIVAAIEELEDQLVPGVQTVSYAGGGMTQNVSPDAAGQILDDLYAELETRPGYGHIADKSRHGRVIYVRMKD